MARLRHDGRCHVHHARPSGTSSPQQRRIPTPVSLPPGGWDLPDRQIARGLGLRRGRRSRPWPGSSGAGPPQGPRRRGRRAGPRPTQVHVAAGHGGDPAAVAEGASRPVPAARGVPGRGTPAEDGPPVSGPPRRGAGACARPPTCGGGRSGRRSGGASRRTPSSTPTSTASAPARTGGAAAKAVPPRPGRLYARDDDGDGSREAHIDAPEGFRSPLRSRPRPRRGRLARGAAAATPPPSGSCATRAGGGKALRATLAVAPVTPTLAQQPGSQEGQPL